MMDLLDQKNLYSVLSSDGWADGELVINMNDQCLNKINALGFNWDKKYQRSEFDVIFDKLKVKERVNLYYTMDLKKACERAIGMRILASQKVEISKEGAFAGGADSTAIVIHALLRTFDNHADMTAEENYRLLNSNKQSERALGSMRHAKEVVMQQAPDLMRRVHTDGFNPSFKEVAEHLYSLLLNKFQTDDIPELDTLKDWVRQCKPEGHNPRTGKKPNGYRSIFET